MIEQELEGVHFLVGLLDGAVRLNVAADVVADVVHQRDGVRLLARRHVRSVLSDKLCKLRPFHQLIHTHTVQDQKTHTHF